MQINEQSPSNIESLIQERDGFKNAYLQTSAELGQLRVSAAPVIRTASQKEATANKPSLFLVTLPKSGTVFISHSLRLTLGLDHTATLVTPTFPKNIIWPEMLSDFVDGGMISVSHMQPDATNISTLKAAGVVKGILHVRDPRAAIDSWLAFAPKRANGYHQLVLNADHLKMSDEDRRKHLIDNTFPIFTRWLQDWLKLIDRDPDLNYLVLNHEDLKTNESEYFRRIMDFYGVSAPLITVEKTENSHFRRGDNSSWRATFTPSEITRLNELMPSSFWIRFGLIE